MSNTHPQLRFVAHQTPRAKTIPPAIWARHKEELCRLYQEKTLDELIEYMREKYNFTPSPRQLIYKFEQWGQKKYNTSDRIAIQGPPNAGPSRFPLSASAPERSSTYRPPVPPKRPTSMGSLQSRDSNRSLGDRPVPPPKKRVKIAAYMADRAQNPFADRASAASSPQRVGLATPSSTMLGTPARHLATLGLSLASPGHPSSAPYLGSRSPSCSPLSIVSSTGDGLGYASSSTLTPTPIRGNFAHGPADENDTDGPIFDDASDVEMFGAYDTHTASGPRRLFDSSWPLHIFSQEELSDMKMAAHFLRASGFDGDAFELFTILFKQLKQPSENPAWMQRSALVRCVRSAFWSSQTEIARNELEMAINAPRETSTDAEQFLYRMLFAETCTRSSDQADDQFRKEFYEEIAIGCELASDRMLDRLPSEHRQYDILTYHYLNKCLEYLNNFVRDDQDDSTIFTDKETLQTRTVERIPGPFELRHEVMQNPCLRSCLNWCLKTLRPGVLLPEGIEALRTHDEHYMYWTDHIALYCALWQRWQVQRHDFGVALESWMSDSEQLMGMHPAELLSITSGMIMCNAPSRLESSPNLIIRARRGAQKTSELSDKKLSFFFLETYSLLSTLLSAAPQRPHHDIVSFFATLINSTREREAFGDRARAFARNFIEHRLNITLPTVQQDTDTDPRQDIGGLHHAWTWTNRARHSMESIATALGPTLAGSIHSSELSSMRVLSDRFSQTMRRPTDPASIAAPSNMSDLATWSITQLSEAMTSTWSLSSTQRAANAACDQAAASSRDNLV